MTTYPVRLVVFDEPPDPTERALFDVFAIADDFRQAIVEADCPARIAQLRERLSVAIKLLTEEQDRAAAKHDLVTQ